MQNSNDTKLSKCRQFAAGSCNVVVLTEILCLCITQILKQNTANLVNK